MIAIMLVAGGAAAEPGVARPGSGAAASKARAGDDARYAAQTKPRVADGGEPRAGASDARDAARTPARQAGRVAEAAPARAQTPSGLRFVRGRVVDVQGRPIGGATVSVETPSGTKSATTDAHGRYEVADAPAGAGLVVLRDGYAAALATAAEEVADVVLEAEAAGAEAANAANAADGSETIEITGEAPPATQGAARLSRAELERLPGAGNDVIRALDAMPGVVAYPLPLGDAGVAIRGSSPQDSKILVDGFEIPMLYHDIGFRSIIPAEAIDKIDYIPGGFDVAYGRASSGIVDLTTRAGGDAKQQMDVSSSDAGALVQGKTERGAYLFAFRRSVIDQLLPAVMPDDLDLSLTTVPRYYDEQLRLDYAPSSKWQLRISSVGADDVLELYTSKVEAEDKRLYSRTRFIRLTTAAAYHDGPWTANLALSGIAQQMTFERGSMQRVTVTSPGVTARGEVSRSLDGLAGLGAASLRLGGEIAAARNSIELALPTTRREGEPAPVDDPMSVTQRFDGVVWTPDAAAWSSFAASLDERIRFTAGLRVDRFERVHQTAVQPRGELTIQVSPMVTARLSAGAYARPPEYQTELLAGALAPERATQLIAGVAVAPREGVRVQASTYYTDRTQLITRVGDGNELGNTGRGTTYGAEVFATAHHGPWFGWLSYAYSHSTRVDEPGGAWRLFDYDQPHSLNIAASYKFGRFQLGARFRLFSGLPQTPINGAVFDSDANLYLPIYGAVNSERAPLHHEIDLRLDRQWRWGPVKMTYFLDIQNAYANQTPAGYLYSFDYQQRGAFRGLPFLPTAGLRGEL